jgi:UDP-N-acetylglucosamine 2-epimerase
MDKKFKSIIFVDEKKGLAKAYGLYDKLSFANKQPLILSTFDNEGIDAKYNSRCLDYYQHILKIDYPYIKQEVNDFFTKLSGLVLDGKQSLQDLTIYKGVSLWEASARYIFFELMPLIFNINLIESLLDLERPLEVHSQNQHSDFGKLVALICAKKRLSFISHYNDYTLALSLKGQFYRVVSFIKKVKKELFSLYYFLINFKKSFNLRGEKKIIFFTPIERFFKSMLPVVLRYKNNERLVIDTFQSGCAGVLKRNKIFFLNFSGLCFSKRIFKSAIKDFLKTTHDLVFKSDYLRTNLAYKGVSLWPVFEAKFNRLILVEFAQKIREIEAIRKIVSLYKPKVFVVADYPFDITLIANSLSIPVVAVQTGHADEFILFRPVRAQAITVDGNYWKEYLVAKGVQRDMINIVGVPKLEEIGNNNFSQKQLNRVSRSSLAVKTIVLATTYGSLLQGTKEQELISQVKVVCDALKNIAGVHLIIKLHICDKNIHAYRKIVKETGISNCTITNNGDMLHLIRNSDLIITHFSASSYEAVLMDKNVVLLSYSSDFFRDDVWDFRRYNAVVAVDNLDDLENKVRDVLFDFRVESELKVNRAQYIPEHAYKIDSKASERIQRVIDKFV